TKNPCCNLSSCSHAFPSSLNPISDYCFTSFGLQSASLRLVAPLCACSWIRMAKETLVPFGGRRGRGRSRGGEAVLADPSHLTEVAVSEPRELNVLAFEASLGLSPLTH